MKGICLSDCLLSIALNYLPNIRRIFLREEADRLDEERWTMPDWTLLPRPKEVRRIRMPIRRYNRHKMPIGRMKKMKVASSSSGQSSGRLTSSIAQNADSKIGWPTSSGPASSGYGTYEIHVKTANGIALTRATNQMTARIFAARPTPAIRYAWSGWQMAK